MRMIEDDDEQGFDDEDEYLDDEDIEVVAYGKFVLWVYASKWFFLF